VPWPGFQSLFFAFCGSRKHAYLLKLAIVDASTSDVYALDWENRKA
jgi:hypothetical protein